MKKYISLIICAAMALPLVACGSGSSGGSSGAGSADTEAAESTSSGYSITIGDVTFSVDDEAAGVIEALGDDYDYTETESCAFQGMDKYYMYSNFTVSTYPLDDTDYILSVQFMDDLNETEEGIRIGSSKDDVISAYGSGGEETDVALVYKDESCELLFTIEDDKVTSIMYESLAAE